MPKPVLVVVDDDDASRQRLTRKLESRYSAHYKVVSSASPAAALAQLEELKAEGADVPLILADQWMPGMTGTEFLARAKNVVPMARRALLISWGDRSAAGPILEAAALGWIEFYLPKPAWSPDEQFHQAVTESLEQWWREQGGRFEAVTVIEEELTGPTMYSSAIRRAARTPRSWLSNGTESGMTREAAEFIEEVGRAAGCW